MAENISSVPLSARAAAHQLAARLGGTTERWTTWLANDRRPGRSRLLPPIAGPGRPRYLVAVVEAFIAAERARRALGVTPAGQVAEALRAVGIGEEGGSTTGRQLDCQLVRRRDDVTGEPYVQLVVARPLLVFRLSPSQGCDLSMRLAQAAGVPSAQCEECAQ